MRQEDNIIYASEGKVLKYKNTDCYMGTQVSLGYRYINDIKHKDVIDDFEEVDDILEINSVIENE